jgi:hypothetical protein
MVPASSKIGLAELGVTSLKNIVFRKTGKEIKAAVQKRRGHLQERLDRRNAILNQFMQDPQRVRSYLIRSSQATYSHGQRLYAASEISSEEREEIDQLCQRIYEIEQELRRLALVTAHLEDDQTFELNFDELVAYGFD